MYSIVVPNYTEIALLLILIGVISWISWKFIEAPFRRRQVLANQKPMLLSGCGIMLVSGLFGMVIAKNDGFANRFPVQINRILSAPKDRPNMDNCRIDSSYKNVRMPICQIGSTKSAKISFAVWGDSHGEAFLPGIEASANRLKIRGIFIGQGGCLPLIGASQTKQKYKKCKDISLAFTNYLSSHPEIRNVMLISRWAIYANGIRYRTEKGHTVYIEDGQTHEPSLSENKRVFKRSLERSLKKFLSMGRRVAIVEQVPEAEWNVPKALARAMFLKREIDLRPTVKDYSVRNDFTSRLFQENKSRYSLSIIQPHKNMCGDKYCAILSKEVSIYRDTNHLTKSYAEKLSGIFDNFLQSEGNLL